MGSFVEGSSRKLLRSCRSSLASEALSLQHVCDLVIWMRILILELLTGIAYRELADGNKSFKLITPFGRPPLDEQILQELNSTVSHKPNLAVSASDVPFGNIMILWPCQI